MVAAVGTESDGASVGEGPSPGRVAWAANICDEFTQQLERALKIQSTSLERVSSAIGGGRKKV